MAKTKMIRKVSLLVALFCLCLPPHAAASTSSSSPSPLCAGSGAAPVVLREPLKFCGLLGMRSCCDAAADALLSERFRSLKISDATCAATVKGIICKECQPSLSTEELSNAADPATVARSIPRLCASLPSPRRPSASQASTKGPEGRAATPRGLAWLLSIGGCAVAALAFAFYQLCMQMFAAGGGQPATNCSGWFSCCASIACCNTETNGDNRATASDPGP